MGHTLWLSIAAVLGMLLATGCTNDDGGPDRSEFVAYWADGDAWCEHVDECGVTPKKECERVWPKAKEVSDALALAQLTDAQLAKCNASQRALDACFLEASCTALSSSVGPACPAQKQRADLDCASLILAFGMTPVEMEDEEPTDERPPSPTNLVFAQMLCQHSTECTGEPTAEQHDTCVELLAQSLEGIPNPETVVGCVLGMTCAMLQASPDAENACLMIDSSNTQCLSDRTLQLCNTDGMCVQTDCEDFCNSQGFVFAGCELSEADGYDQCLCEL